MMEVGFVGLGRMGTAMARNAAKAGHTVRAWNRSPVDALDGIAMPSEVLQTDVSFTMLSDDAAIREVILAPGVLASGRPGLVHVVTSTISIAFAEELSSRHAEAGIGFVSAPVFGRPEVAEAAQLSIIMAGAPDAVAKARPVLEIMSRRIWDLGGEPKLANVAKIAGNMTIAMAIEGMAEAARLTKDVGLAPAVLFDLMLQTQFSGSRAYENYSAKILSGDYEPGFRLHLGLKDLGLAADAAQQTGADLPMLQALRTQMGKAAQAGLGDRDWSAVAAVTFGGG
jgi:3-hydroxyisobutyrate dehydrogenase-like beta-hydroxyacid dehydrogenase